MTTFATPDPIAVHVELIGDVRITASDRSDTIVTVRPHNEAKAGDVRAAEQTRVEFADGDLLVKMLKSWKRYTPVGGGDAIDVTIELPTGSRVDAESAMGDLRSEGELGDCRFKTAMGSIRLDHTGAVVATTSFGPVAIDRVVGPAEIRTASGDLRVGEIIGTAYAKNSNGRTEIGDVTGDLRVKASNGDILIGRARSSVVAKTANGDVRIGEVDHGTIVIETAAGELAVGIGTGIAAWLDVSSRMGSVRKSLDTTPAPAPDEGKVEVRARTGLGDILISRAPTSTPPATQSASDAP